MKLDLTKILETLVNVVFMFFGNKLKGYRTILLNAITLLLALWEYITGSGLFSFLCTVAEKIHVLNFFCAIEASQFYVWILAVVAALNMILRKLTDTPVGYTAPAAAYSFYKPTPIVVRVTLWATLASVVYLILSLFV